MAELERLLSAVTAIVSNMQRLGGLSAVALQVDDSMKAVDRLSSWVELCSRQLSLHDCAGGCLAEWRESEMSEDMSSLAMSSCGSFAAGIAQQQQVASAQVGDEQQQRCIVISGPDMQGCSITQALLMRCAHRGSALRSKLLLGRLRVQFRTFQQARRAHKEFTRLGCIMGSLVQCVIVHDSAWPKSLIQRGKPGGRRHRGHGRGVGGVHGLGDYGCGTLSKGGGEALRHAGPRVGVIRSRDVAVVPAVR